MSDTSTAIAGMKPMARSRVTNGKDVLPGIDGRTSTARLYRDILDGLIAEYDATSESDLVRCHEVTRLRVKQAQRAAALVRGEPCDDGAATTDGNAIRRHLRDLSASWKARKRAQRSARA